MSANYNLDCGILLAFLENASEGFIVTDSDFNVLFAFSSAIRVLGLKGDLEDYNFRDFVTDKINLTTDIKAFQLNLKTTKDDVFSAIVSIHKYNDKKNLITLLPVDDNTLIESEDEHFEITRQGQHAFLASMAHDMRTPLQSLIGFSQVMLDGIGGQLTEKQDKYMDTISKNSKILLRMINNLTDYSKIYSNRLPFAYETFNVVQLIESAICVIQPLTIKKDLKLITNTNLLKKTDIYSDRARLLQVLISMLDNAIKFASEGVIKLELTHPPINLVEKYNIKELLDYRSTSYIMFSISDSGKGIPDIPYSNMFDEYFCSEMKSTRKYGISNLNMVLSSKIVQMLGGNIWYDSEVQEETVFRFIIPSEKK